MEIRAADGAMSNPDNGILGCRDHWLGNRVDLHVFWSHVLTREHLLARVLLVHDIVDWSNRVSGWNEDGSGMKAGIQHTVEVPCPF